MAGAGRLQTQFRSASGKREMLTRPALAVLASCFISFTALARPPISESPILGRWSITEDGCTETYQFRKDGTFSSTSRKETRHGRFTLEALRGHPRAPYKVVRTNLRDNLGKDCAGSSKDDTGTRDTRYLVFNRSRDRMMVCSSPDAKKCFGPLVRRR
jgi:hypothetical protein